VRTATPALGAWPRIGLLLPLLSVAAGCARQLQPIFQKQRAPLVWPAEPAKPKIRYVGQLKTSKDLKPPAKPFQALGNLLVGEKKPDELYGPRSLIRTPDGARLWIADPGGRCLHMFDLEKRTYRKIDKAGSAHLLAPVGLCLGPEDSMYLCDSESAEIHRLSTRDGSWLETLRLPADVIRPVDVFYDASAQELFVVDVSAHNIKVLGIDGRLRRLIGRRGSGKGEFNFPCDIADNGAVMCVVDSGNQRVQGLTHDGEPVFTIGQAGDAPGDLALPKGVAFDADGNIYVVDARFENVQIFDSAGRLLLFFGEEGSGPGQFWLPGGIFIDPNDRIWICDSYNGRVQVFDRIKEERAEPGVVPVRLSEPPPVEPPGAGVKESAPR
jgi:sugar lactone lactonase YvrE